MKPLGVHCLFWRTVTRIDKSKTLVILLMKRDYMTGKFPGYWGLPGGCVEAGETSMQALKREIEEELELEFGGDIINSKEVPIFGIEGKIEVFSTCFGEGIVKQKSNEGLGVAWFNVEELHHIYICPEHRVAINQFLQEVYR